MVFRLADGPPVPWSRCVMHGSLTTTRNPCPAYISRHRSQQRHTLTKHRHRVHHVHRTTRQRARQHFLATIQPVQGTISRLPETNSPVPCAICPFLQTNNAFQRTNSLTKETVSPYTETDSMTKDAITHALFTNSIFTQTYSAFLRGHRAFKDAFTQRFSICRASVTERTQRTHLC